MLKESLRPCIEDLYFLICCTRRKAGTIRMKSDVLDHASVVTEGLDNASFSDIPELYGAII